MAALESEIVTSHRKLLVPTHVEVPTIVTFWSFLIRHISNLRHEALTNPQNPLSMEPVTARRRLQGLEGVRSSWFEGALIETLPGPSDDLGCQEAPLFKKFAVGLVMAATIGCGSRNVSAVFTDPIRSEVPADIAAVFQKPVYSDSVWGLRVVDSDTGEVLIDSQAERRFYIASVRKAFSVGLLLNATGASKTYDTAVFRQGAVDGLGVLDGDLVLVASGDLTVGGRLGADGKIELTEYDHNEANDLGNAVLSTADPLAGYKRMARQVAESGITRVTGQVVVDDRLFEPFRFRGQFDVTPVFVNDNVVDVSLRPTTVGNLASVEVRPLSSALTVVNALTTSGAGTELDLELEPELPAIGLPAASVEVKGSLPIDFVPPLTDTFPLVRNFRITNPSNFARTVFIEALEAEGVEVDAATVADNPVALLPAWNSYTVGDRVAILTGSPVSELARYVMKVSYNIGADTSLVLFGLTKGVKTMTAALLEEQKVLINEVGLKPDDFRFLDGSGGGETTATTGSVTKMLDFMLDQPMGNHFVASMPALAVDGSLGFVTDFKSDPTLVGAEGKVYAKTGTYAGVVDGELMVKGQAFAGYIDARSGRRLTYIVVVNNVPIEEIDDMLSIFQDEGIVSAILWRDF